MILFLYYTNLKNLQNKSQSHIHSVPLLKVTYTHKIHRFLTNKILFLSYFQFSFTASYTLFHVMTACVKHTFDYGIKIRFFYIYLPIFLLLLSISPPEITHKRQSQMFTSRSFIIVFRFFFFYFYVFQKTKRNLESHL